MPALWDPLSACRIVLICRAQIVYSSSERPSGRRILTMSQQPVFRFEAEGSMYVDKCWCRASVKCQLQRLYSQVVAEKSAGKVENRRLNLSVKNVEIVGRMSVIQENVRTCDLLCAKALLSGFHTFRASMCWLALVAEMLLLEVGHSKERRVSVDVKAGLLQLLRVVLQRSEVRVSLNTSTCPGVPCKASIKPASACRELPCASRGPLGISGGEKTGSSPTASDRGCLNNSFGIRSQG